MNLSPQGRNTIKISPNFHNSEHCKGKSSRGKHRTEENFLEVRMCCLNYPFLFNHCFSTLLFSCWTWMERKKTSSQLLQSQEGCFEIQQDLRNLGRSRTGYSKHSSTTGQIPKHHLIGLKTQEFKKKKKNFQSICLLKREHLVKLFFQVYTYT